MGSDFFFNLSKKIILTVIPKCWFNLSKRIFWISFSNSFFKVVFSKLFFQNYFFNFSNCFCQNQGTSGGADECRRLRDLMHWCQSAPLSYYAVLTPLLYSQGALFKTRTLWRRMFIDFRQGVGTSRTTHAKRNGFVLSKKCVIT